MYDKELNNRQQKQNNNSDSGLNLLEKFIDWEYIKRQMGQIEEERTGKQKDNHNARYQNIFIVT